MKNNYKTWISFFFVLYMRYVAGMFFYAPKLIDHIEERSESYVRDKRPEFLGRLSHSLVCSENKDERLERCAEAVKIDHCRYNGISLPSNSGAAGEPKVYGVIESETMLEDIIIACTCPTKPKIILLADAYGYSEGQVNVMIYDPKPLTREQFDVYRGKFTGMVKGALPNIDIRNRDGRKTASSGLERPGTSSKDSSVGQQDSVLRGPSSSIESSRFTPIQSFGDSRFASFNSENSEEESYNEDSDGLSPDKSEGESEMFENPFYKSQSAEKNVKKFSSVETSDSSKEKDKTSTSIGKSKSLEKNESSSERSFLRQMGHDVKKKAKKVMRNNG